MRTLPEGLTRVLNISGVTPLVRMSIQVPSEAIVRVTAAFAVITVSVTTEERGTETVAGNSGSTTDAGEAARALAQLIQDAEIEGLWAEADVSPAGADGTAAGTAVLRIVVSPGLAQLPAIVTGAGTELLEIRPASYQIHSADVPVENQFALVPGSQSAGTGSILSAEPLKTSIDPITRRPVGAQFSCTVSADEGMRRLFRLHPSQAFSVQLEFGAYHSRDTATVGAGRPNVAFWEFFGEWFMKPVSWNEDGTIVLTVTDAITRLNTATVVPQKFTNLHPNDAMLLHLEAAGFTGISGLNATTFRPIDGLASKGHFVVGNVNADFDGIPESPKDSQPASQSLSQILSDFLTLTGDTLRVGDNGSIDLVTYDPDAEPVAHFRAGPDIAQNIADPRGLRSVRDAGFDATAPTKNAEYFFNRVVWNIPTNLVTADNRDGQEQTFPERIEQIFESKASRDWTGQIEDLSIESPFIARSTTGSFPAAGHPNNAAISTPGGRTIGASKELRSSIYAPELDAAGTVTQQGTDRFRVVNPMVQNWCGLRVNLPTPVTPAEEEIGPDFIRASILVPPETLDFQDTVASLDPEAGRWLIMRVDPPGSFRPAENIPPNQPTTPPSIAFARAQRARLGDEIEADDDDYGPELVAIGEWLLLTGVEENNREQVFTEHIGGTQLSFNPAAVAAQIAADFPNADPAQVSVVVGLPVHRYLRNVQAIIDTDFERVGRLVSGDTTGRGINGTTVPFRWQLGYPYKPNSRATLTDVTIAAYRSAELLDRYEFGAPEIEFDAWLSYIFLQVGDVITIDDPNAIKWQRIGFDDTVTWEITGMEIHWLSDEPKIRFTAVMLKDNRVPPRHADISTILVPRPGERPAFGNEFLRPTPDFGQGVEIGFRSSALTAERKKILHSAAQTEAEFLVAAWRPRQSYDRVLGRFTGVGMIVNEVTGNFRTFDLESDYTFDIDGALSVRSTGVASQVRSSGVPPESMELRLNETDDELQVWALGTAGELKRVQFNTILHSLEWFADLDDDPELAVTLEPEVCAITVGCEAAILVSPALLIEACDITTECFASIDIQGAVEDVVLIPRPCNQKASCNAVELLVNTLEPEVCAIVTECFASLDIQGQVEDVVLIPRPCNQKASCDSPDLIVDAPPVCAITLPAPLQLIPRETTFIVTATAQDDRGIASARLFIDQRLVEEWPPSVSAPPLPSGPTILVTFTHNFDTSGLTQDGGTMTFEAFDTIGQMCRRIIKYELEETPANEPVCAIVFPSDGAENTGIVPVTATATDGVGIVSALFRIDNIVVETFTVDPANPTPPPFTHVWDTTALEDNTYIIEFEATNTAGLRCRDLIKAPVNNKRPPTCNIIFPGPGATVTGFITPIATAEDDEGIVLGEWFVDDISQQRHAIEPPLANPPLFDRFNWDTRQLPANQGVVLMFEATDTDGLTCRSIRKVTIGTLAEPNQAPRVIIFQPMDGAEVQGGGNIVNITASITDDAGATTSSLFVNDALLDTDVPSPIPPSISQTVTHQWDTTGYAVDTGYVIDVVATDAAGNTGRDTIKLTLVSTAPAILAISITSPTAAAMVSGMSSVAATITDDLGAIQAQLFVAGDLVETQSLVAVPVQNVNFIWDTNLHPNGNIDLRVLATDADGNTAEDTVTVEINNVVPPLQLVPQLCAVTVTCTTVQLAVDGDFLVEDCAITSTCVASMDVTPSGATASLPKCAIISPRPGELVRDTVTVTFAADDVEGITLAELYVDAVLEDSNTYSPAQTDVDDTLTWDASSETEGNHTIRLRVVDTDLNECDHEYVVVVANEEREFEGVDPQSFDFPVAFFGDFAAQSSPPAEAMDQPPTVVIIDPKPLAEVSGDSVLVTVGVGDDFGLELLLVLVDGRVQIIQTFDLQNPETEFQLVSSFDSTRFDNGIYDFTATVTDTAGQSTSSTIQININNPTGGGPTDEIPPTVDIQSPTAASTVSGVTSVIAQVNDNIGAVFAELRVNGQTLDTQTFAAQASRQVTLSWDTSLTPNGNATVEVFARDAANNEGFDIIFVEVSN